MYKLRDPRAYQRVDKFRISQQPSFTLPPLSSTISIISSIISSISTTSTLCMCCMHTGAASAINN